MRNGYSPTFRMPRKVDERKKEEPTPLLIFFIGAATGAMVMLMVTFVFVLGYHRAYASNTQTVSRNTSDIFFVTVGDVIERFEPGSEPQDEEVPDEPVVTGETSIGTDAVDPEPEGGYYEDPTPVYSQQCEYIPQPDAEGDPHPEKPVNGGDGASLRTQGVQYDDDGTRYTWYSQNVLPGGGLDIPGRSVGDDGFIVDGDGNLCVASSDHEKGTVLETPYGTAVVYDTGCASGTVDMYTNW